MKQVLTGKIEGVYLCTERGGVASMPVGEARVTLAGFEGDRHAGMTTRTGARAPFYPRGTEIRNSRQVSLVSLEELAEVAAELGLARILPEWLGANLAVSGVPRLTFLPPATRLFFPQETVLVVQGENLPCTGPGQVIQDEHAEIPGLADRFPKAALHRRGLVAWVERAGLICPGDDVRVDIPEQRPY